MSDRRAADRSALELLERHGIVQPPVPVEQLAREEGIQVVRTQAAGTESGFILRDSKRIVIGINSRNSRKRQRFTIAHERIVVGHTMTNLKSKIEWTDTTWNPTSGCTKVSPGCDNCYAERITERFHGKGSFNEVKKHHDRLDAPLRWRKPRRVFVNSMSDLFHDDVSSAFIASVFDVMRQTPQHTYQILTKRHGRMRALMKSAVPGEGWPLPNVWLGVSVEDQIRADLRVPALLETPATVRFL